MEEKTILLAEGEKAVADRLCKTLKDAHYKVDLAFDGRMGKRLFDRHLYDLALVDFRLPDTNGCELCDYIRRRDDAIPLMVLSSAAEKSKLEVFRVGVDDYWILKPDLRELLMRIRVLIKRASRGFQAKNRIRAGELVMDLDRKEVTRRERPIFLSAREFLLLQYLIENKNRIVSRSDIARIIWAGGFVEKERRVAAFINSLRSKIDDGHSERVIFTVTGKGYLLTEKVSDKPL